MLHTCLLNLEGSRQDCGVHTFTWEAGEPGDLEVGSYKMPLLGLTHARLDFLDPGLCTCVCIYMCSYAHVNAHMCAHGCVCVCVAGVRWGDVLGSTVQIQKQDSAIVFTMNIGKSSESIKARTGV